MSLEIKSQGFDFRLKQFCGGCLNAIHDPRIFEGASVMIGPKTETAKLTGWGDSTYFLRVFVAFDTARPKEDSVGQVHFTIPTYIEEVGLDGKALVTGFQPDTLGHELKPLG